MSAYPVFVICRDRLGPLARLVTWLEQTGHEEIYLVDNDSAYPPLLEYYAQTRHEVIRLGANVGHLAPWSEGIVRKYAGGRRYVVTDFDVVPDEACPADAVVRFSRLLDRYPTHVKAGFGLRIDDLPHHNPRRSDIVAWERYFWRRRISRGVYHADIDTTFALYREDAEFAQGPAIRTGPPYVARHLPWYDDPSEPSEEVRYYQERANQTISTWAGNPESTYALFSVRQRESLRDEVVWQLYRWTRLRLGLRGDWVGRVGRIVSANRPEGSGDEA